MQGACRPWAARGIPHVALLRKGHGFYAVQEPSRPMEKYSGAGDKDDLDNHANQLNPNSDAYESSRSGNDEDEDED